VELDDEFVVNLSLHFLFGDYEPGQSIVGALFHSLHREETVRVNFLDKEYFCVRAPAETRDAFEVLCRNIEVLFFILCLFLVLFNVE